MKTSQDPPTLSTRAPEAPPGQRAFYPLLPALHAKDAELRQVYESTSWRITRPIRALKDYFLGR